MTELEEKKEYLQGFREGSRRIHTSGGKADEQGKGKVAQTWTRKF